MAEPKYPDLTITLPEDGDPGVIRSRAHKALSSAVSESEAQAYLHATAQVRDYPGRLLDVTAEWMVVEGNLDPHAVAIAPRSRVPVEFAELAVGTGDQDRWQYAVVNVGSFNSPSRMAMVLSVAGENGWELVAIYDKSSNWFQGWEKGFMLLKRQWPAGSSPDKWCLELRG